MIIYFCYHYPVQSTGDNFTELCLQQTPRLASIPLSSFTSPAMESNPGCQLEQYHCVMLKKQGSNNIRTIHRKILMVVGVAQWAMWRLPKLEACGSIMIFKSICRTSCALKCYRKIKLTSVHHYHFLPN